MVQLPLFVSRCHPKQRKNLRLVCEHLAEAVWGIGGTQQTVASATEVAAAAGFDVCLDLHVFFLELANLEWKLKFSN